MLFLPALALLAACATSTAYARAKKEGAIGYMSQQLETGRHRVSYTDTDPMRARNLALLRAAEITLMEGKDWFEITHEAMEQDARRGGGSSISIGGGTASGSYGRSSSVGVGVGFGIPLGGSSAKATQILEIVTGAGPKPDKPEAYDARSVEMNLRVASY
jgi:hypothetical protein